MTETKSADEIGLALQTETLIELSKQTNPEADKTKSRKQKIKDKIKKVKKKKGNESNIDGKDEDIGYENLKANENDIAFIKSDDTLDFNDVNIVNETIQDIDNTSKKGKGNKNKNKGNTDDINGNSAGINGEIDKTQDMELKIDKDDASQDELSYYQETESHDILLKKKGITKTKIFAKTGSIRKVYIAIKIDRFSDILNVKQTFRCRFHFYMSWLMSKDEYDVYISYKKAKKLYRWYILNIYNIV